MSLGFKDNCLGGSAVLIYPQIWGCGMIVIYVGIKKIVENIC
jgi:hypothetical protein